MKYPIAKPTLVLAVSILSLAAQQASAQDSSLASAAPSTNVLYADSGTYPTVPVAQKRANPAPAAAPSDAKVAEAPKPQKVRVLKELQPMRVNIERGTLTVDGLTSKAALTYKVESANYLYMYIPGTGTVVVARSEFPGATQQKRAFHGDGLTVRAGGHVAELYSDSTLLSRRSQSAWVRLDKSPNLRSRTPLLGFGDTGDAPYEWPTALPLGREAGVAANAPALPRSMLQISGPQVVPVSLSVARSATTSNTASAYASTY